MNFTNFSISELQSLGITGDEEAITELAGVYWIYDFVARGQCANTK